ncbi:MAG: L,D-transpeptidase family protein [Candidatus Marinimicrobia bacterium]|nr:L,D-transpeptidase family protein [Candidatus Neomarinimicrobiota bacterium]
MYFPVIKKSSFYLIAILLNYSLCCCQIKNISPIPSSSCQMILVITNSFNTSNGILFRFERDNADTDWKKFGDKRPVIVGKNGLAWGVGLHKSDTTNTPIKREGDGKSPAGIFPLSSTFGYFPVEKMGNLIIPYIHVTDMLECVDDVNSKYYNSFVLRSKVENVDWHSSEKMLLSGIWYELGVVIDHNTNSVRKGAGSCIFLHNWAGPADSTSGCTAMAPSAMKDIIYWLDASKKPILVQLTKQLFINYKKSWELPALLFSQK